MFFFLSSAELRRDVRDQLRRVARRRCVRDVSERHRPEQVDLPDGHPHHHPAHLLLAGRNHQVHRPVAWISGMQILLQL